MDSTPTPDEETSRPLALNEEHLKMVADAVAEFGHCLLHVKGGLQPQEFAVVLKADDIKTALALGVLGVPG